MAPMNSIVKQIQKSLGGNWTYDLQTRIWKDDTGRYVKKDAGFLDGDVQNETNNVRFVLYGDGVPREIIITGTPLIFNG